MGRFVIVAYRPKAGGEQRLLELVEKHVRILRAENLVSHKPAYVMRAGDGTIIEVFEWLSAEAIEKAHDNPQVQSLWSEFEAACEYVPLARVPEAHQPFSEFESISA